MSPSAPAARGGLAGPAHRSRGRGLGRLGRRAPLLCAPRALGRGSPAPAQTAGGCAGLAPEPGGGASP